MQLKNKSHSALFTQFGLLWNVYPRFIRVLENLESPGILLWHFPGLESPGKSLLVLESSGNLLNSRKKAWNVWQTVRRINIKIMGMKGLMWILESWKNQSESWKSSGNLFLKKGTNPVYPCNQKRELFWKTFTSCIVHWSSSTKKTFVFHYKMKIV